MNKLPSALRAQIIGMMVEGVSIRSITRLTGVSKNTVAKLLVDAGQACAAFHDQAVRGVTSKRIQVDEIWSFVYAKQKNVAKAKAAPDGAGDIWTWTALDADHKLIISWLVGNRDGECALALMDDLRTRLANRVQLTTDGHKAYLNAVEESFGADVDYAMLVKIYGQTSEGQRRYSPPECIGCERTTVTGSPDQKHISTSYVERQNLNIRMGTRRFTRLTNAFSKKAENHAHALAIYFVHYNFVRIHKTLRVTPAMAAGVSDRLFELTDMVRIVDEWEIKRTEV